MMKRSNLTLAAVASFALGAAAPVFAQDEHNQNHDSTAQADAAQCPMMSHDEKGSGMGQMSQGMMGRGMGGQQMMQMM